MDAYLYFRFSDPPIQLLPNRRRLGLPLLAAELNLFEHIFQNPFVLTVLMIMTESGHPAIHGMKKSSAPIGWCIEFPFFQIDKERLGRIFCLIIKI
jgi:hypothetical protein